MKKFREKLGAFVSRRVVFHLLVKTVQTLSLKSIFFASVLNDLNLIINLFLLLSKSCFCSSNIF